MTARDTRMSAPAFTPGPWLISSKQYEYNEYRIVIRAADHSGIAEVWSHPAHSLEQARSALAKARGESPSTHQDRK